jgi:hypothetical protein
MDDGYGQLPSANVSFLATDSLYNQILSIKQHIYQQQYSANVHLLEAASPGNQPRPQRSVTASLLPVPSKLADSIRPPVTHAWASSEASKIVLHTKEPSKFGNFELNIDAQLKNVYESPFEYPPLYDTTSSIRLLRIESYSGCGPYPDFRCTLEPVQPWKDSIPYVCLSYCWGDSRTMHQILVGVSGKHRPLTVTENLYNALKNLSKTHECVFLWIDAICINQSDPQERAFGSCKRFARIPT